MANPKNPGQDDYYSFERVLKELQIEDEELRRLVSEGEIRAFRDDNKMKFRRSDIDGLKKGRMTEPTIILPQSDHDDSAEESEVLLVEEEGDSTSETLLDIGDVPDEEASSGASVPMVDLANSSEDFTEDDEEETLSSGPGDTNTEELTFEQDSGSYVTSSTEDVLLDSSEELATVGTSSPATVLSSKSSKSSKPVVNEYDFSESGENVDAYIDSDTGYETEPLGDSVESNNAGYGEEQYETDEPDTLPPSNDYGLPQYDEQPAVVKKVYAQEEEMSPAFLAMIIAASVLLLFGGFVAMNTLQDVDTPATGWLSDFVYSKVPAKHLYQGSKIAPKQVETHLKKRQQWRN